MPYEVQRYTPQRFPKAPLRLQPALQPQAALTRSGTAQPPKIGDDLLYLCLEEGELLAMDEETGNERWRLEAGEWEYFDDLCLHRDRIYTASGAGVVVLDARTGALDQVLPSPELDGTLLVVVAGRLLSTDLRRERLITVSLQEGEVVWEHQLRDQILWFAADDEVVVVSDDSGWLRAIGVADGQERWRHDLAELGRWEELPPSEAAPGGLHHGGWPVGFPMIIGQMVVSGVRGHRVCAFAVDDGALLWDVGVEAGNPRQFAYDVSDGWLYLLAEGRYGIIDARDGTLLRQEPIQDRLLEHGLHLYTGDPTVTETHLYFTDGRHGHLAALNKQSAEVEWVFDCGAPIADATIPVVANHRLYVSDLEGGLHAFEQTRGG
jgi:outer membrane protein assembly factor BamB